MVEDGNAKNKDSYSGDEVNNDRNGISGNDRYTYQTITNVLYKESLWSLTRMNIRKHKRHSFSHLYLLDELTSLVYHIFLQYNLKAGLKSFKDRGINTTRKEMKQLHDVFFSDQYEQRNFQVRINTEP